MNPTSSLAAPGTGTTPPAPTGSGAAADRGRADVSGRERLAALVQRQGVLAVLLLVVVIASFVYPTFATLDNARG